MTEQKHPITPPLKLMQAWAALVEIHGISDVFATIARWGADQEQCASNAWLVLNGYGDAASRLCAARRPKPPSLKEEALEALMTADGPDHPTPILYLRPDAASTIRRALEALPDD